MAIPLFLVTLGMFVASTAIGFLLRAKPKKNEPNDAYSWEPQTAQREGIPHEIVLGTVPVQGNAFEPWTSVINTDTVPGPPPSLTRKYQVSLTYYPAGKWNLDMPEETNPVAVRSQHQLNVRLALAEGPVQGLQAVYSRLNGKALADWAGLTATERKGTDVQTATGLGDRVEFPRDDMVASGTPVTIAMRDKDMDDAAIIVGSTEGLLTIGESGGRNMPQRLGCKIEVRDFGGAWTTLFDYYLFGQTRNPVRWVFLASGTYHNGTPFTVTPGTQPEWRVTNTYQPSTSDALTQGQLKVLGVQAIYNDAKTFPGLAYLELQAVAAEGLQGSLSFEGVLDGQICETLAGGTFAFARKPAVASQFLWTLPVLHGDGGGTAFSVDYYRGYDPSDLNAADFAAADAWFNASVPNGKGGTEARFEFNGRFSEPAEAWENPARVAAMCHAVTWFDGRQVRMYVDKTATPAHVFCDGNMLRHSYQERSVDKRNHPTALETTLFNQDAGWIGQRVRVIDKSAARQRETQQIDSFGCTRVSQFTRFCRRIFDKNRLLDLTNSWRTGPCGMDAVKGEVAYIQSDCNGRAVGGRVLSSPAAKQVAINHDVILVPGITYRLILQTLDDDGKHVVNYKVGSLEDARTIVVTHYLDPATGLDVALGANLLYTPVKNDVFIYGAEANIDMYRIVSTKPESNGNCEFAGEQYQAAYYANDDVDPYFNTQVYVTAAQPQRQTFQPVTWVDLVTNYDDSRFLNADESDTVLSRNITFAGDAVDHVTWGVNGTETFGWLHYHGISFPILANAIGTTERFIYFDPAITDGSLQSTDDLDDLKGEELFLGCVNLAGVAYPQNWQRVGVNDTSLDWSLVTGAGKPDDNADVTEEHAADISFTGAAAPAQNEGALWRDTAWCGINCVAHWRMNDNAANPGVKDESPSVNHGVANQNTSALTAAGKVGTALTFNGTTDKITVPNAGSLNFGTDDFGGVAWIKTSYTGGWQRILSKRAANLGFDWAIEAGGDLGLLVGDSGGYTYRARTPAVNLRDGAWHFVGFTLDRDVGGYFYIDGVLSTVMGFTSRSGSIGNSAALLIGADQDGSNTPFHGTLDNVALFKEFLNPNEFDGLYDAGTGTEEIHIGCARTMRRSDGTYWLLADSDSPTIPRSAAEVPETSDRFFAVEPGADATAGHTAADTAAVAGTAAATVKNGAANGASAWGKFSGAGSTLPSGNVEFNFAGSASKGGSADNTVSVGTQTATAVQNATVNFNGRNDRTATAVATPTIAGDGSAIDHTIGTDGTASISLEWSWAGTNTDIDGWIIFVRQSTNAASYDMGTTPAEEQVFYVTPEKRAFLLYGVAANQYYTFGVQAYRIVDPDVNAAGVIKSTLVQPALAAEDPYRPSATVAFAGDLTGTINGSAIGALATLNTVATAQIDANAVSQVVSAFTALNTLVGDSETTEQSAAITTTGGPVLIDWGAGVEYAEAGAAVNLRLYRDASLLVELGQILPISGEEKPAYTAFQETPTAAAHTYYLKVIVTVAGKTAYVAHRLMRLTELKR